MQPPNEAPVTIFAIIVCWFYGLNYVRGMPDRVGDDNPSGIRVDHFCLFISLWR